MLTLDSSFLSDILNETKKYAVSYLSVAHLKICLLVAEICALQSCNNTVQQIKIP